MALFALVDCNNFYASCERVFQPELRGKPIVVLSNNDGCVIARSNEAKALGVAMGEAWHLCRKRIATEGIVVRSSNYTLYGDMSARVMQILARFSPALEIYSIDEAFLGMEGFEHRLQEYAQEIRRTVLQWTGVPVSVGIAGTKTLAKAANRFAKKDPSQDGVCILTDAAAIDARLAAMPMTDLWGVARRLGERLAELGMHSALDLKQADPRFIRERFNVVLERTALELQGVSCLDLEHVTPDRKSIIASRSFGQPVFTKEQMAEGVSSYVARAAEKMRRQQLVTAQLTVFIQTNRFRPQDAPYNATQAVSLPIATADTGKLITAALRGLEAIWRPGYRYKKGGVMLLDLHPAAAVQVGLFDKPDSPKAQARMQVIDRLNRRYGRDTVIYGASGARRAWKLRRDFISPRYTTAWNELLRV